MPTLNVVNAVSKMPLFALITMSHSKWYQGIQLELLHHQTKDRLIYSKNVWETEGNRFCFVLSFWPPVMTKVTKSGIKY